MYHEKREKCPACGEYRWSPDCRRYTCDWCKREETYLPDSWLSCRERWDEEDRHMCDVCQEKVDAAR